MTKKALVIIASAALAAGLGIGAAATAVIKEIKAQIRPDFTIEIDGEVRKFKNANGDAVYPILYEGTTYLPVRAIGEIMGKTVYWYEDDKRIELREEVTTVTDADVIIHGTETKKEKKEVPVNKNENASTAKNERTESLPNVHFIGEEKAKEIALEKAELSENDVVFKKVKLDKDDGVYIYEVEFRSGKVEYDIDIGASDGKVLSFEKDIDD